MNDPFLFLKVMATILILMWLYTHEREIQAWLGW